MPYDLFTMDSTVERGTITPPNFENIKKLCVQNLKDIADYYTSHKTFVPNEHVLVKLLLSMITSMDRSPKEYVDAISESLSRTCAHFKFCSPTSYGVIHEKGTFYNLEIPEIIMSDERAFDVTHAAANWRQLRPVRVLNHPFTDLSIQRLNGKYRTDESGYVVISINIPMLALQYKMWSEEERMMGESGISNRTHHFVSMYPITNMMYSHLDWCIVNRLCATYFGNDKESFIRAHPFNVLDVTDRLDDVLDKEVDLLVRRPMSFDHMIEGITLVTSHSLNTLMHAPHGAPTRQFKWGLIMARISIIRLLVQVSKQMGATSSNRMHLNRLRRQITAILDDKGLRNIIPAGFFTELSLYIDKEILAFM